MSSRGIQLEDNTLDGTLFNGIFVIVRVIGLFTIICGASTLTNCGYASAEVRLQLRA